MDKDKLIELISKKMKLIRTEYGYTQDKMADILGVSKKTLVQIEKERTQASWANVIEVCVLFRHSEVLQAALCSDPIEIVETVAHESVLSPKQKTLGGKVWWKEIVKKDGYRIQQNLVSHHFRIVDDEDYRWFSSFNQEETVARLEELSLKNRR